MFNLSTLSDISDIEDTLSSGWFRDFRYKIKDELRKVIAIDCALRMYVAKANLHGKLLDKLNYIGPTSKTI